METNEQLRRVLSKALEEELESFLKQMSELAEGELEKMEERVVKSSQAIGRKLMEGMLNSRLHKPRPAARRQGSCGHVQRLVEERPKELITLVGPVRFVRPYYHCLHVEEQAEEAACSHGEAPADALWGVGEQRTTPGVQRLITYLCARLTFEEAAQTLCRCVPIGMSGRQALTLMRPVAEALAAEEDRQVRLLQAKAQQARSKPGEQSAKKGIERLYIELDGVFARMRRGSVPMEKEEQQRPGDVYRPRQSALCGTPHCQRRFWLVALPVSRAMWAGAGPASGCLGRRRAVDLEPGRRTLSPGRADCRSLPCRRACVGGRPRRLWTRLCRSQRLGHDCLRAPGRGTD